MVLPWSKPRWRPSRPWHRSCTSACGVHTWFPPPQKSTNISRASGEESQVDELRLTSGQGGSLSALLLLLLFFPSQKPESGLWLTGAHPPPLPGLSECPPLSPSVHHNTSSYTVGQMTLWPLCAQLTQLGQRERFDTPKWVGKEPERVAPRGVARGRKGNASTYDWVCHWGVPGFPNQENF